MLQSWYALPFDASIEVNLIQHRSRPGMIFSFDAFLAHTSTYVPEKGQLERNPDELYPESS